MLMSLTPHAVAIGDALPQLPSHGNATPSSSACTAGSPHIASSTDGPVLPDSRGPRGSFDERKRDGGSVGLESRQDGTGSMSAARPGVETAGIGRHRPGPLVPGNVLDLGSSAAAVAAIAAAVAAPQPNSSRCGASSFSFELPFGRFLAAACWPAYTRISSTQSMRLQSKQTAAGAGHLLWTHTQKRVARLYSNSNLPKRCFSIRIVLCRLLPTASSFPF